MSEVVLRFGLEVVIEMVERMGGLETCYSRSSDEFKFEEYNHKVKSLRLDHIWPSEEVESPSHNQEH